MCDLALYVLMAVMGIYALAKNEIALTRTKVVSGVPARIIGVLLIVPLPLAIAGFVVYVVFIADIDSVTQGNPLGASFLVTLVVLFFCVGTSLIIAFATARPRHMGRRKKVIDTADQRPVERSNAERGREIDSDSPPDERIIAKPH
jgi:hypothetical protein